MRKTVFWITALVFSMPAFGADIQSTARQVTLVEIYTSEACGNCAAAGEWAGGLKTQSKLWKDFVPVLFHVDSWDNRGWHDPFSSPKATARQRAYMRLWRSDANFLPVVAMNGRPWKRWERLKTIPVFKASPGVLTLKPQAFGRYQVVFEPQDQDSPAQSYEAHLALLGFDLESQPGYGENAGRKLTHQFSVLDYQRVSLQGSHALLSASLSVNAHDPRAKKQGIAVWVTKSGSPIPVQAAGGYI